jgi:steroid 5-alpha reductase family enzyme
MTVIWLYALPALLTVGAIGWTYAASRRNVNIVDSLWSLFFLLACAIYLLLGEALTVTSLGLFLLVAMWSIRLSLHLSYRNMGKSEDRRYAAMRARNPRFNAQSLLTVFGLQAVLAWVISLPLAIALIDPAPASYLHYGAMVLFIIRFMFEAGADWQLTRFKADPKNHDRVLDSGFWRYSRHPNYFGESLIWWSFYLFALASGAAWTIFSPVIMTLLLLKVSGVTLLEKDIHERRPAYRSYIERTPSFLPWWPRRATANQTIQEGQS